MPDRSPHRRPTLARAAAAAIIGAAPAAARAQAAPACGTAPAVAGFRLGDSVADVARRFRQAPLPLPVGWEHVPVLQFSFSFIEHVGVDVAPENAKLVDSAYGAYMFVGHPPGFAHVGSLDLYFRAGRLVSARVLYEDRYGAPPGFQLDAYARTLSDSLALPAQWRPLSAAERHSANVDAGRRVTCPTFRFDVAKFMVSAPDVVYAVSTGPEFTRRELDAQLDTLYARGLLADERERQQREAREGAEAKRFVDSAAAADPRRPRWAYELARHAFASCVFHLELVAPGVEQVAPGGPLATMRRLGSTPAPGGGDSVGDHVLREVGVQARVLGVEPSPDGRPQNSGRTCDPSLPAARKFTFPTPPQPFRLLVVDGPAAALTKAAGGTRVEVLFAQVLGPAFYYVRQE